MMTNWYQYDHLGTPLALSNEVGEVVAEWVRDPFGTVIEKLGDVDDLNMFPGQFWDEDANLAYNWNRWYSPETGRYTQTDPMNLQSVNYAKGALGSNAKASGSCGNFEANLQTQSHPLAQPRSEFPYVLHGTLVSQNENELAAENPYLYAGANPIGAFDPYGLEKWCMNDCACRAGAFFACTAIAAAAAVGACSAASPLGMFVCNRAFMVACMAGHGKICGMTKCSPCEKRCTASNAVDVVRRSF